jgi:hypothetical protein
MEDGGRSARTAGDELEKAYASGAADDIEDLRRSTDGSQLNRQLRVLCCLIRLN